MWDAINANGDLDALKDNIVVDLKPLWDDISALKSRPAVDVKPLWNAIREFQDGLGQHQTLGQALKSFENGISRTVQVR